MAAVGSVIYGADYNTVALKIRQVLGNGYPYGPGTGQPYWGYNQTLSSSLVAPTAIITAAQWNNLRSDVDKVYRHQTNATQGYSTIYASTGTVSYANLSAVDGVMSTCVTNANTVSASQLTQSTLITNTYGSTWGGSGNTGIRTTGFVSFADAATMQYFFNQGGKLVLQGNATSNSATTQDQNWNTALNAMAATINLSSFSSLGSTMSQIYYAASQPSPYTSNFIKVEANVVAASSRIYFQLRYQDVHSASGVGPDVVSSGAGFKLYQYAASGAFSGATTSSTSGAYAWIAG